MGRTFFLSLILAGALGCGASGATAQDLPGDVAAREGTTVLEPRGGWTLDMRESKCRLARWFGDEDDVHLLLIEQTAPQNLFSLTLAGSNLRRFRTANDLRLGMEPNRRMTSRERFAITDMEDAGPAIILGGVRIGFAPDANGLIAAGISVEAAATIEQLVVADGRDALVFASGNMERPIRALNACTTNLLNEWGLDPQVHQSYTPAYLLDREAFEKRLTARYPRGAIWRGEQGIFRFRAIVETDGSVSDCMIENVSTVGDLDPPACDELRKARFEPAKGADGSAIRSFFANAVNYRVGD